MKRIPLICPTWSKNLKFCIVRFYCILTRRNANIKLLYIQTVRFYANLSYIFSFVKFIYQWSILSMRAYTHIPYICIHVYIFFFYNSIVRSHFILHLCTLTRFTITMRIRVATINYSHWAIVLQRCTCFVARYLPGCWSNFKLWAPSAPESVHSQPGEKRYWWSITI